MPFTRGTAYHMLHYPTLAVQFGNMSCHNFPEKDSDAARDDYGRTRSQKETS
jgi:hypothetical protein